MWFLDDLNRKVTLPSDPQRVISLCPSITETLIQLGVNVVGRTKFCIHPKEKIKTIKKVGGTKSVHYSIIEELKPDFIIGEKEENTLEIIETLEKKFPVYVVNVETWKDALKMLLNFGKIFQKEKIIHQWLQQIPEMLTPIVQEKKIGYLIWNEPIMAVGKNTYIHDVISQLGFENPFHRYEGRYPSITMEDLKKENLDFLFLSSEPFPFKEKHVNFFQSLLPRTKVLLVDGEMFSWYGVRMKEAVNYFARLID